MSCNARQFSDQMYCYSCELVWDKNDPEPPACKTVKDKNFLNEREVADNLSTIRQKYLEG